VLGAVLVVMGLFLEREEKEAIQRQRKDQAMKRSGRGPPPAWWTAGPGDHFLIFNASR
jgi:Flp pilus assembly protein protease CpaA